MSEALGGPCGCPGGDRALRLTRRLATALSYHGVKHGRDWKGFHAGEAFLGEQWSASTAMSW